MAASRSKLIMFIFFAVVLGFLVPLAQAAMPRVVSLTGIFYLPGEKGLSLHHAFTVYVQGKEWIFDVEKAQNLRGGSATGWEILDQEIFPSILRFWGPSKYLGLLEKPEIAGKPITIEGFLYVDINTLYVTRTKDVA